MSGMLSFKTRLAASFANSSFEKAPGSKKGPRKSDLRSLCIALLTDIQYYKSSEPEQLETYVAAQKEVVQAALDVIERLHGQIAQVLQEKGLKYQGEPVATLKVSWEVEEPVVLLLMKMVLTADEVFAMLEVAKEHRLADGAKLKSLRAPVIAALQDCFQALMQNNRKYHSERKGGLYSVGL